MKLNSIRAVVLSFGLVALANCKPKVVAIEQGSETEALKVANKDGSFDLFWAPTLVPDGAVTAADNLMCFYSLKLNSNEKSLLPKKGESSADAFARLSSRIQQVNTIAGNAEEWNEASNAVLEFDDTYFIDFFLPKVESNTWVESASSEDRNVSRLLPQVASNLKSALGLTCPPAPVFGDAFSQPAKADETEEFFGAGLPDTYKNDLKVAPEATSDSMNLAGTGRKNSTPWLTRGKRFACYATLGVCHASLWLRDTLHAGAGYANKRDRARYERDIAQPSRRVYRRIGHEAGRAGRAIGDGFNTAGTAIGNGARAANDWAYDNGRKLERVGERASRAGSKIGGGIAWGWNKFTTIFTGP